MKCGVTIVVIGALLLTGWGPTPVKSFIPDKYLGFLASVLDLSTARTTTHVAMTRTAILRVAADLLKDNPFNDNSRQKIDALADGFDEKDLIRAYHGEKKSDVTRMFRKAIDEIGDANAGVDHGREGKLAPAHFDSERLQKGQNRIYAFRQRIITSVKDEKYTVARTATGRMLHTLQDFYSHTNWVEMGQTKPYSELGKEDTRPVVASEHTLTCTDCTRNGKVLLSLIYIWSPIRQSAQYISLPV